MSRFSLESLWPYLLIPLAAYLCMLAVLYFYQSRLLYYPNLPSRQIFAFPDSMGMTYQSLEIVASDGVKLHGWFLPVENPRATVLFFMATRAIFLIDSIPSNCLTIFASPF